MTTENNKLIAEFMGMTTSDNDESMMIFKTLQGNDIMYIDELKYHESWDWLMPVIENIDHLQLEPVVSIENALATRSIDDTYKAVVEFIKKYNNIKEHKKEDIKNEIENFIIYHCGSNDDELTYLLNCLDAYIDNDHIINE